MKTKTKILNTVVLLAVTSAVIGVWLRTAGTPTTSDLLALRDLCRKGNEEACKRFWSLQESLVKQGVYLKDTIWLERTRSPTFDQRLAERFPEPMIVALPCVNNANHPEIKTYAWLVPERRRREWDTFLTEQGVKPQYRECQQ
jgi:hypothetical protein